MRPKKKQKDHGFFEDFSMIVLACPPKNNINTLCSLHDMSDELTKELEKLKQEYRTDLQNLKEKYMQEFRQEMLNEVKKMREELAQERKKERLD